MRISFKHMYFHLLLPIVAMNILLLSSCTKNYDDYGPQGGGGGTEIPENSSIIVLNEGNFMFGNGSVSVIDTDVETAVHEVFKNSNGYPIGDVPQSINIIDSLGYILVNNSGKIEVVQMPDFKSVNTITGFTSPRQMEVVSENPKMAWVTDLYANKIWEINLESNQITGSVPSAGWNENIEKWKSTVLVLNKKDSVINMFDIASKSLLKTYQFGNGIVDFRFSDYSQLMVLAKDGIYRINLLLDGVYQEYQFNMPRTPLKMAYDSINAYMYFLDSDLYRYSNGVVEEMVSVQVGSNFYGLAVKNEMVFLTDAKDYVQPGEMRQYSSDFQDSVMYTMGINPQFILFP